MNLRYSSRFSTQCARNALAETDVLGLIYFSYRPTCSCESMTSAAQSYCPLVAFRPHTFCRRRTLSPSTVELNNVITLSEQT